MEEDDPTLTNPLIEADDPTQEASSKDKELPYRISPYIEKLLPSLTKLRKEPDEPKNEQSSKDIDDASRSIVYKLSVDPMRKQERSDNVDPMVNISTTLIIELSLIIP